jgi:hypothetical protein
VYRFGDLTAAWLQAGLRAAGSGLMAVAVCGIAVAAGWGLVAMAIGRRYQAMAGRQARALAAAQGPVEIRAEGPI